MRPVLKADHAVVMEVREGLASNPTLARSRSGQALSLGAIRYNIRFRINDTDEIWLTTDKDTGLREGTRGRLAYQAGWLVRFTPE